MSAELRQQTLIDALGRDLRPVRRLLPAWLRAAGWLALVAVIAVALLIRHGAAPMLQRWAASPDLVWSTVGAALTALCAAWAACELAVPGRSRAWLWLPLPGFVVWISASGWGCLRALLEPATATLSGPPPTDCLTFIVGFSLPLSIAMIWLLRRACPLRPVRAAILVGLASAAAAACLMTIFHPIDSAATDLLTHALAVCIVIGANAAMGNRLLSPR